MPHSDQYLSCSDNLMPHSDQYLSRPFRVFDLNPLWPKVPFAGFPLSLSIFTFSFFHFSFFLFFFVWLKVPFAGFHLGPSFEVFLDWIRVDRIGNLTQDQCSSENGLLCNIGTFLVWHSFPWYAFLNQFLCYPSLLSLAIYSFRAMLRTNSILIHDLFASMLH